MARRDPAMASKERRISSSRDWVSTWMVTSSGIMSSSMIWRQKSKSVWLAEGKPTSISLKPRRTSSSNMRSFRRRPIGSTSAWLPSRRSTEHQMGGWVMTAPGQVRSGRSIGWKGGYLSVGSMLGMATKRSSVSARRDRYGRCDSGTGNVRKVRRRYGYTRRAAAQARRAPVRPRSRMPRRSNMTPRL